MIAEVLAAWWVTLRCWWDLHRGGWYVLNLVLTPIPLSQTRRPRRTSLR